MKRDIRHPNFRSRAVGTLLLALPFGGLALPLSLAQAQPAPPTAAKKKFKPLSPAQKADIARVMTIAQATQVGTTVVDFKMENASLDQVIARIKTLLPDQPVAIEVRGARPIKVSFDLKETRVGTVLNNVAGLAGCRLWVVGTGFLIAPKIQLTEGEVADMKAEQAQGGEWTANVDAGDPAGGNNGWSSASIRDKILARTVAQEISGGDDPKALPAVKVKMTFADFSPNAQGILQQLADSATALAQSPSHMTPPIRLSPLSPISIDTSQPGWVTIGIDRGLSDDGATAASLGISIR